MLSVANCVRLFVVIFLSLLNISVAKEVHILVIGQSISSNCNQNKFGKVDGVYQFDLNGNVVAASDPFIWADCNGGSMWMPLGERMIKSGLASKVVFMPIGIGGTKVSEWLVGGRAFGKLETALSVIAKKGITFDYVLWHQGSSDIGTPGNIYQDDLHKLYSYVRKKIGVVPWVVARHSRCYGRYDEKIDGVQQKIVTNAPLFFYAGPDNNSLDDRFRFDSCHLNKTGQIKMAELWFESIEKVGQRKESIEKETLLYWFKKIPY
ncbi:sialate O-acetylesterase [Craterilacuibacter sinensis]|uniref:Sialate O-acetylesterase domain-containing protein n=1 Tax=Craterilacuibacter sinensis TaxID=2686017 RepID=A0A845BQS4_9NEIS|nr:sialate O-acetylesterase [Craterilacuibacter sinensis]MXR36811.1 hypothetical protein [Craterilacuibacter sinensis]